MTAAGVPGQAPDPNDPGATTGPTAGPTTGPPPQGQPGPYYVPAPPPQPAAPAPPPPYHPAPSGTWHWVPAAPPAHPPAAGPAGWGPPLPPRRPVDLRKVAGVVALVGAAIMLLSLGLTWAHDPNFEGVLFPAPNASLTDLAGHPDYGAIAIVMILALLLCSLVGIAYALLRLSGKARGPLWGIIGVAAGAALWLAAIGFVVGVSQDRTSVSIGFYIAILGGVGAVAGGVLDLLGARAAV